MRNIKKTGVSRLFKLTFLLVFIFLVIIVLAKSCFDNANILNSSEDASVLIEKTSIINNGKINVNQERYFYDLGLLPESELPEIYQVSEKTEIAKVDEVNFVDVVSVKENVDINIFDDLELRVDFDQIQENVSKSIIEQEIIEEINQLEEINQNVDFDDDFFGDEDFDDDFFGDEDFGDDFFGDEDFGDDFFSGGFDDGFGTPFEPLLFEPYIQTQEEYDLFNPIVEESSELDDSFFDDFYIAGESDEALFEDGIYYLTLYVNDDRVGDVETVFEGSVYSISANSLYDNVKGLLSDYGINRLFNTGVDYYTIEDLNELGVQAEIDVVAFEIYLIFGVDDMPIQYLPVSSVEKNTLLERNEKYGISDAIVIEPDLISGVTTINLASSYTYGDSVSEPYFDNSLSLSNSINIADIEFTFTNDFDYTIYPTYSEFEYDASSWDGTYYFRDKDLKLTFGNVGSYLGTDGTSVGFTLDKSYSYGSGEALKHQYKRHYLLEADSIMYIYINDDEEIVKRLRKGEYILQDFPLSQGANHVRIKIIPNEKIYPIILDEFDIPYDSRLLSKGDYLYGVSAAISKSVRDDDSTSILTLPYLDLNWYDYDLSDFDTKFYIDVGLTHYFTLNSLFAFSLEEFNAYFSGILATASGPFTGTLLLDFSLDYSPQVETSISHTIDTIIGDISATLQLNLPIWDVSDDSLYTSSEIGLSLGHSIDSIFGFPLTTSITSVINDEGLDLSISFSSNYTPNKGVSLSSSLYLDKDAGESNFDFSLSLSVGYNLLSNLTSSKTISTSGSSSLTLSYKPTSSDSLNFTLGGLSYFEDTQPTISTYWQHIDTIYSILLKHSISDDFEYNTTSATFSTSLFYAGGLFALNQSASSNFIIIKPEGEFANNPISIGKTNSSTLVSIDPTFGNVVYTKLTANSKNNLIAYGTTESLYSSGSSFSYELTPTTSSGFSQKISSPVSYTVSGVLLQSDGTPFVQYSSPIYDLLVDENGVEYLQNNENLYLFTDLDGRFILSDVPEGTYLFDMDSGTNSWYGLYFVVKKEKGKDKEVILLEDYMLPSIDENVVSFEIESEEGSESENAFGDSFASDYIDIVEIKIADFMKEDDFWNTIFPPIDESVDDFAFEDTANDWENSLVEDEEYDESEIFDDSAFTDTADDWESSLGEELIETVVVEETSTNPNYTYVP
ncbi:MAG: hypothetical protein ACPKM0_08245 [Pleomorphochaeta sp.]